MGTEEGRCLRQLTIFGELDREAFVFPNDGGRWRTDDVTDDVGVVAFIELLRAWSVLEGDFLCGRYHMDAYYTLVNILAVCVGVCVCYCWLSRTKMKE